jgi:hypothetical protein
MKSLKTGSVRDEAKNSVQNPAREIVLSPQTGMYGDTEWCNLTKRMNFAIYRVRDLCDAWHERPENRLCS